MVKIKTLMSYILFISLLFFKGFAELKITAQNRVTQTVTRQPFDKCLEIKNNQIDHFASDNQKTILIENTGEIRLFNNSDNFQNWNIQLGSKLETIPYIYRSNIILLSYPNENEPSKQQTTIRQINSLTGISDWIIYLDTSGRSFLFEDIDNSNITVLSQKLNILQTDSNTGKILWNLDLKGELRKHTFHKSSLYVLTTEDKLFEIHLNDGSILSETGFKSGTISAISSIMGSLFLGDTKGVLYELANGQKVKKRLFRTGGEITSIQSFESDLLIVSNDNFLYYYSTEKGEVLWKKRLSGRVILEPIINGDLIFVTTLVEPLIYIYSRTDGALINRIDPGDNYVIKNMEVNESSLNVLTTTGLLKFGLNCRN